MLIPGLINICKLPTIAEIERLKLMQVASLLNVSGINIYEMYEPGVLSGFNIAQFDFSDVFTSGREEILDLAHNEFCETSSYLQVSTAEHRAEFLAAVKKLIGQMATQTPTCIFCHRGLGRSPLVVAAAFQYFYHESVTDAINRTLQIQQKAQFSYLSLSALHWCRIHLNHLS